MQQDFDVPKRWQSRFEFYQTHGLPSSSRQARAAFKALPYGSRMRLNANGPAFLFGPFYFMAKGMWRKGITLLVAALALGTGSMVLHVSNSLSHGIATGFGVMMMMTANYAYYLHVSRHSRSWNPMEGFGRRHQHRSVDQNRTIEA